MTHEAAHAMATGVTCVSLIIEEKSRLGFGNFFYEPFIFVKHATRIRITAN